jgi:hypothetical protein
MAASGIAARYGMDGVRTFAVKGTPYGPLGTGTGCGFGEGGGLVQRLFFVPDVRMTGYAIDPEYLRIKSHEIEKLAVLAQTVPVYQTFSRNGQNLESQVMLRVESNGKILQAPYEISRPVVLPKLPLIPVARQEKRTEPHPYIDSCGGLFSQNEVEQMRAGNWNFLPAQTDAPCSYW